MKPFLTVTLLGVLILGGIQACGVPKNNPTSPQPVPTATFTTVSSPATSTPSFAPTLTETQTGTYTSTHSPTASFTPTVTFSPTHTLSPTITNTFTVTPTFTYTPSSTSTSTPTPTATNTPTDSSTASSTLTASGTPTLTATVTDTASSTNTPTNSATKTPTHTATSTATHTATTTFTPTSTITPLFSYVNKWNSVAAPGGLACSGTGVYVANGASVFGFNSVTSFTTINSTWSSYGSTALIQPSTEAVNRVNGHVYIADIGSSPNRVYQVTSAGATVNESPAFSILSDVETDSNGNYYAVDNGAITVYEYDTSQTLLKSFGKAGSTNLSSPTAVALDSSNNIYIADSANLAIYELSSLTGNALLHTWTLPAGAYIYQMAVNASGTVFAADGTNNVVDEFLPGSTVVTNQWNGTQGGGTAFTGLDGLCVLPSGNILTADSTTGYLQEFVP